MILYGFEEFSKNLSKIKYKLLKYFIQRKEMLTQNSDKGRSVVNSDRDKYAKGIKSLFLENNRFTNFTISNEACVNFYVNAKSNFF